VKLFRRHAKTCIVREETPWRALGSEKYFSVWRHRLGWRRQRRGVSSRAHISVLALSLGMSAAEENVS
jgi:hypothetical protein